MKTYDKSEYFENKVILNICVALAIITFISTIINILIGLNIIVRILSIVICGSSIVLYFAGKKYQIYSKIKLILSIELLLLLNIAWFYSSASKGPMLGLYPILIMSYVFIWNKNSGIIFSIITLINVLILFFIEFNISDWVSPYNSELNRLLDMYQSAIIYIILAFSLSYFVKKGFMKSQDHLSIAKEHAEINEAEYKNLITTAVDAIIISDQDGKIRLVNPAAVKMFGYNNPEEMIGIHATDLYVCPNQRDILFNNLHKDGFVIEYELKMKRKDGSEFIALDSAVIQRDADGNIISTQGIIRDITDRKLTEEGLIKEKTRASNILEGTNAGTWDWNVSNDELILNERWAEIMGYTLKELEPIDLQTWEKNVHPDDLLLAKAHLERHLSGKQEYYDVEFRQPHKNGSWIWVNARGKVVKWTEDGKPLQMSGTHIDITERKKAEMELVRNYEQQILLTQVSHLFTKLGQFDKNMQEVLQLIGEYSQVSRVYIFEDYKEGKFTKNTYEWCNKGVAPQLNNLQEVPYEIIPSWKSLLIKKEQVLTSNIFDLPQDLIDILEPQHIKAIIVFPIYVMNQFFGFIGFDDCTHNRTWENNEVELLKTVKNIVSTLFERKLAENDRELALQKAKQANKVKDLFLANMSHELRTPLNSLLGFIEVVEDSIKDRIKKEEAEHFQIIRHSGKRLIKTIHGVLDISQIETGTILFSREIMPLAPTVEQIYNELKPQADAKKLKIMFDNQIDDGCTKADESLLIKAVSNIVENAIKYTEAGEVSLTLFKQVGHYVLSISDTGIGMSPDYMKHMYETFTQESAGYTKKYQGLGLGLSIAKSCLDLLEIAIDVESKKDVGTTFRLTFKREEVVDDTLDKPAAAIPKVIEADDIEKPMVLIVEDDEDNRKVLDVQLKSRYRTCCAVSVNEAMKQLKQHNIDLVLLDLALEDEATGLDLVAFMKTNDKLKDIPIIAVTAHTFTIDREKALNAGCDDYMSKPIDIKELLGLIKRNTK